MANTNIFNTVKSARPKRHYQDLSHSTCFDFEAGKLIPFCCFDAVPGDKFKIGTQTLVRAITPFQAPQLSSLRVKQFFFAVPFRLLDENFPEFIAKVEGADSPKTVSELFDDGTVPSNQVGFVDETSDSETVSNHFRYTIADYLGLPILQKVSTSEGKRIYSLAVADEALAFPWLAYNLIWNTRFRDEQLQSEHVELSNEVLKVNWKKDYFTSAFLSQQAGVEPVIGTTPIDYREGNNVLIDSLAFNNATLFANSGVIAKFSRDAGASYILEESNSNIKSSRASGGSTSVNQLERLEFNNSNSNTSTFSTNAGVTENAHLSFNSDKFGFVFTPSQMRLGFAIQRFQEALLRGGQRYEEYSQMMFGVSPGDARIQRPEYIGGCVNPVVISEVVQTGASLGDDKLGKLGGHGIGAGVNYIGSYFAKEHCLIMGLMYLAPDLMYSSQGVPKWLSRRVPEDYYCPPFAWLSEQPIYEKEIFYTGNSVQDNTVFGYQGIWNDMRCRNDDVRGALRDDILDGGLNFWHMARKFGSAPQLNSDFIEMNPVDRVFGISGVPHWLAAVNVTIKAFRPMPKFADAGLVDHVYGMR